MLDRRVATSKVEACAGRHPLAGIVDQAQQLGHQVWAVGITGTSTDAACCPMAVCRKCGGWTFGAQQAKRKLKLLQPCEAPTEVGKTAWKRIAGGKHPKADSCYKRCKVIGLAPWPDEATGEADAQHDDDTDDQLEWISLGDDKDDSSTPLSPPPHTPPVANASDPQLAAAAAAAVEAGKTPTQLRHIFITFTK